MTRSVDAATAWIYSGIWGVLTRWFRVPSEPPTLPAGSGEQVRSFRPANGFLRYLKFRFWVLLLIVDVAITIAWLVLFIAQPKIGLVLAPVAFAIAVFPDIVAYIAIHLRYDTTWYVFTDRSLRIRRGIWTIHETTITFENIQNVSVNSGPLERFFGIANVVVDTAGGGAGKQTEHKSTASGHQGMIEGIDNAADIRELILNRVRRSRSAGLGDEAHAAAPGWSAEHIRALREIRDALAAAGR
jgi:membrane protein YdbS with pleckstrin-like domain